MNHVKRYLATVQILLDAESEQDAADILCDYLADFPEGVDWSYLRLGAQWLYPVPVLTPEEYEEGHVFEQERGL